MLDNGAWPAFRDQKPLSLQQQVSSMTPFLERAEWIIAPDIVAAGQASWERTEQAIEEWPQFWPKLLLPIQDGIPPLDVIHTAEDIGAGVFVGGSTHQWKIDTAKMLRGLGYRGRLHVGRIAHPQHLGHLAGIATSIDNTTWVRAQHYNRRLPLVDLVNAYVHKKEAS